MSFGDAPSPSCSLLSPQFSPILAPGSPPRELLLDARFRTRSWTWLLFDRSVFERVEDVTWSIFLSSVINDIPRSNLYFLRSLDKQYVFFRYDPRYVTKKIDGSVYARGKFRCIDGRNNEGDRVEVFSRFRAKLRKNEGEGK